MEQRMLTPATQWYFSQLEWLRLHCPLGVNLGCFYTVKTPSKMVLPHLAFYV